MIVHPSKGERPPLLIARLADPETAQLENGEMVPLRHLERRRDVPARVFAPWDLVDGFARDGHGELVCWGDEPIRWRPVRRSDARRRGSDVVIVKLPYPDSEDFLRGLQEWRDWLRSYGAEVGWSLGGTSMALLRATLERELVTTNGALPPARWTLGGRQQSCVEPGTEVRDVVHLDLPAAYSRTVGEMRYGGAWRDLERPEWAMLEALSEAGMPVLVHATVRLAPGLAFGPLPRRPRRRPEAIGDSVMVEQVPYPVSGRLTGTWSFEEVQAALEAGSSVVCDRAWVHVSRPGSYPFAPWLGACVKGRELDGWWPRLLAKATANALWGQFVIDDSKEMQTLSWTGKTARRRLLPGSSKSKQLRAWDLGEVICGRVRAQLYEMMEDAGNDVVCVHTDGGWIQQTGERSSEKLVATPSAESNRWRVKERASTLQVLDQQHLRYQGDDHRWRYALSGVPASRAAEVFEKLWEVYSCG